MKMMTVIRGTEGVEVTMANIANRELVRQHELKCKAYEEEMKRMKAEYEKEIIRLRKECAFQKWLISEMKQRRVAKYEPNVRIKRVITYFSK